MVKHKIEHWFILVVTYMTNIVRELEHSVLRNETFIDVERRSFRKITFEHV